MTLAQIKTKIMLVIPRWCSISFFSILESAFIFLEQAIGLWQGLAYISSDKVGLVIPEIGLEKGKK